MKEKYNVTGMTCSACSSRVEKSVGKMAEVNAVTVNLLTNSMVVEYDESKIGPQDIIKTVENAGYGASLAEVSGSSAKKSTVNAPKVNPAEEQMKDFKLRLAVSFAFLIPLMYVSMGHMIGLPLPSFLAGHENAVSFAFTQLLLCLPVIGINIKYFTNGFKNLWHRAPNMDSLIAIGSAASLVYGIFAIYRMSYGLGAGDIELVKKYHMDLYFESAAMILALITFGKFLEAKSKGKTSEALEKLLDMAPKTAIVERNGEEIEIPAEEVILNDIVIIKPGSSIPVDGVVLEGETSVDESAITGESIPVHKEVGMTVIGATINKSGYIKMRATKVGENTTFSQIIKLVEEASATKAPIAKLADKIAGIFVPTVIGIALVTALVWLALGKDFEFALSSAITVLVISCPCALGLATPVAIMVGTGKGAENGILIKSGEALETLHSVKTVILDKTGTITEGKPKVTDILSTVDTKEFLSVAAGLESMSEHPLAEAIIEKAREDGVAFKEATGFEAISGKGIRAKIGGDTFLAGNARLMNEAGVDLSEVNDRLEKLADQGKTPLVFAKNKNIYGIIAVADVVKSTSKAAIDELKKLGIETVMLTGDNTRTANGIGRELNLDRIIADVLPQDKERVVSEVQQGGKTVAMVGDGVNDAPALVRSDVGIAIGSGTDVAAQSADVILMKNDLLDVVSAIRLSKAVIKNIKQNLFWAFFYNCLGIPLAAGVFSGLGLRLTPMFGAAAMSMSSVFVVTNALRLRKFMPNKADGSAQTQRDIAVCKEEKIVINNIINTEEKENTTMITLKIEGMMCQHCVKHVKNALEGAGAVDVVVSLEEKQATMNAPSDMAEKLAQAVRDADYTVTEIIK
ncbi:MAG: heavy metal translocating P-type ATPase [Clostridia bacterium]|nr:heavy metal translocating P-type ATPase [Clostridia bacterium]